MQKLVTFLYNTHNQHFENKFKKKNSIYSKMHQSKILRKDTSYRSKRLL